jgi:hypothetical protein
MIIAEDGEPLSDRGPIQLIQGGRAALGFKPTGEERDRLPVEPECARAATLGAKVTQKRPLKVSQSARHPARLSGELALCYSP